MKGKIREHQYLRGVGALDSTKLNTELYWALFPKLKRGKLDPAGSTVHINTVTVEIAQVKVKRGQRKCQNI